MPGRVGSCRGGGGFGGGVGVGAELIGDEVGAEGDEAVDQGHEASGLELIEAALVVEAVGGGFGLVQAGVEFLVARGEAGEFVLEPGAFGGGLGREGRGGGGRGPGWAGRGARAWRAAAGGGAAGGAREARSISGGAGARRGGGGGGAGWAGEARGTGVVRRLGGPRGLGRAGGRRRGWEEVLIVHVGGAAGAGRARHGQEAAAGADEGAFEAVGAERGAALGDIDEVAAAVADGAGDEAVGAGDGLEVVLVELLVGEAGLRGLEGLGGLGVGRRGGVRGAGGSCRGGEIWSRDLSRTLGGGGRWLERGGGHCGTPKTVFDRVPQGRVASRCLFGF